MFCWLNRAVKGPRLKKAFAPFSRPQTGLGPVWIILPGNHFMDPNPSTGERFSCIQGHGGAVSCRAGRYILGGWWVYILGGSDTGTKTDRPIYRASAAVGCCARSAELAGCPAGFFLDCGRRSEDLEKIHPDTRRTCRL